MWTLADYLDSRRRTVDAALRRRLPAARTRPAALHRAMRYSLFPGGKRLRPILCLAAAEAVRPQAPPHRREAALGAALAVEVLHTYTLIHDDLPCMDDDDLRRGQPTVHKVFGEANAVLAGDALQALAFEWAALAEQAGRLPAGSLVRTLAAAAGSRGVVGGQVEDIAGPGRRPRAADVAFVHRHKTADLFNAATCMGGIAAGAGPAARAALGLYGDRLGMAFQITDDLLDDAAPATAAPANTPAEFSCLAVMDRATARRRAATAIAQARAALHRFAPEARRALDALAQAVIDRTT